MIVVKNKASGIIYGESLKFNLRKSMNEIIKGESTELDRGLCLLRFPLNPLRLRE